VPPPTESTALPKAVKKASCMHTFTSTSGLFSAAVQASHRASSSNLPSTGVANVSGGNLKTTDFFNQTESVPFMPTCTVSARKKAHEAGALSCMCTCHEDQRQSRG
jgi:hypothetical protein